MTLEEIIENRDSIQTEASRNGTAVDASSNEEIKEALNQGAPRLYCFVALESKGQSILQTLFA